MGATAGVGSLSFKFPDYYLSDGIDSDDLSSRSRAKLGFRSFSERIKSGPVEASLAKLEQVRRPLLAMNLPKPGDLHTMSLFANDSKVGVEDGADDRRKAQARAEEILTRKAHILGRR